MPLLLGQIIHPSKLKLEMVATNLLWVLSFNLWLVFSVLWGVRLVN